MQDRQAKVLETFNALMPKMTVMEQEKLLSYGEGLTFLFRDRAEQTAPPVQGGGAGRGVKKCSNRTQEG